MKEKKSLFLVWGAIKALRCFLKRKEHQGGCTYSVLILGTQGTGVLGLGGFSV